MNNTINILYQIKDFGRFILKIFLWLYSFIAIVFCIMISFTDKSYFEASDAILKALIALFAYKAFPYFIDWCIKKIRLKQNSASN